MNPNNDMKVLINYRLKYTRGTVWFALIMFVLLLFSSTCFAFVPPLHKCFSIPNYHLIWKHNLSVVTMISMLAFVDGDCYVEVYLLLFGKCKGNI